MSVGIRETWNGWQRNLICMWLSQLLICTGFSSAFSFIPLYLGLEKFGLEESMIGYWTSRFNLFGMLAYAVFTPLWGALGDRWGVKLMLYRGSFVTALIYPLLGLTGNVYVLIALRFVTGALSGTTIAAQTLLVKTTPNDRQGYSLGVLGTAIWGGYMIGEVLGGAMTHFFGFTAAFFLCGALFFISGLCVIFARDSEKSIDVSPVSSGPRPGLREHLKNASWLLSPAILMMLFLFLMSGISQRASGPYTSLMVKELVGREHAAIWTGVIGMCAAFGSMISGVVMGSLSDKFPEWKLTTPMQILSATMLFCASGATTLFGFGFCHAANSFAVGGLYAVFQKVASGLVERVKRGTVLGFATTMYNAGYMLAMLLSGWVVTRFGLRGVYRTASALMLALALASATVIYTVTKNKYKDKPKGKGGNMKKWRLVMLAGFAVLTVLSAAALVLALKRPMVVEVPVRCARNGAPVRVPVSGTAAADSANESSTQIVRGMGFVRGRKRVVLRNKFAGFVTKVNIYSQTLVKKGDVIIEYDDLDARTAVEKLENSVSEQKKTLELKQIELELKKLDPLPSEYRKTQWKLAAAKKRLERHSHELDVYKRLNKNKSISELQLREKEQEVKDAEAELKGYSDDLEKLQGGMANSYVQEAEKAVEAAKLKLANLERELDLAKEQLKYYKIVAPYDGVCITNSDTQYSYNAAGTEAVEINAIIADEICPTGKYVYAYFEEDDLCYVQEGVKCRFRSNQYDCEKKGFAELLPFQVKKQRYSYGDKTLHLVKFRVMKETEPLRIDSTGFVEIEVPDK